MQLRVSENGRIVSRFAFATFDEALEKRFDKDNPMPNVKNTMDLYVDTDFKFNEWNRIGLSYNKKGVYIRVNEKIIH